LDREVAFGYHEGKSRAVLLQMLKSIRVKEKG